MAVVSYKTGPSHDRSLITPQATIRVPCMYPYVTIDNFKKNVLLHLTFTQNSYLSLITEYKNMGVFISCLMVRRFCAITK